MNKNVKYTLLVAASFFCFSLTAFSQRKPGNFTIGDSAFLLNGKPFVIRCGELHYARIPRVYWRQRLRMAKAMGLNTVCAYLFWNFTQKEPGKFDWSGQADAAQFCRIAQQEGLYVILRPGPYSCAEWDFGGFPWWLLKDKTLSLRTQNPHYLEASKKYLLQVGRQLAPLQINKGGNIIMVQVENEYGSFGNDKAYIGIIRDDLKAAGFSVPFFTCDGPHQLKNDVRPDIFAAVNFGSDPQGGFRALRAVQSHGPLMCSEYYPGWFDSWGDAHHTGSTGKIVNDLKWMLDHKASFSIYMVHGGTSFGTYSGANGPDYLPQTTSYDYDAPIDEAGNPTPKYYAIRDLLSKYLMVGEKLPEVPPATTAQRIPVIHFTKTARLWDNLPKQVVSDTPMLMEDLNQGFGAVLYQAALPAGKKATLRFEDIHDYALIYINKELIDTIYRHNGKFSVELPARAEAAQLQVLVEAMGRINYGPMIIDRKGIHGKVVVDDGKSRTVLKHWTQYPIRLGDKNIPVTYRPVAPQQTTCAAFYKATFSVDDHKDTYLDMRRWHKGLVWINGICLGRYWQLGPTQTMYVPGCWLKQGTNEIVVFDLYGNPDPAIQGLDHPILDQLATH